MAPIGKTRRALNPEPRGVLHRLAIGDFAHGRIAAPADLADRIEHFWIVRWNLEGLPAQVQETLPHPNVHIVIEPGAAAAWGVHGGRWTRVLEGRSSAFGIKFRPGAFRPLLGRAVSGIANRSIPLTSLFGDDASALDDVLQCERQIDAAALASAFLRTRLPAPDAKARLAATIVDSIVEDPELHSAEDLARRFDMNLRALQRLFNDYVGIGPKWIIKRYRLHEAVARVQAGQRVAWAALAQDLGYFDQPHFIADFRKLVGKTPGDYARDLRQADAGGPVVRKPRGADPRAGSGFATNASAAAHRTAFRDE